MKTDNNVKETTIEKLKNLLTNFNTLNSGIDMYSLYIRNTLNKKVNNN